MTAEAWDGCDDFDTLRRWLLRRRLFRSRRPSPRKAVLLAVAHGREVWPGADPAADAVLYDAWERYADGGMSRADLDALFRRAKPCPGAPFAAVAFATFSPGYGPVARVAVRLLREVLGNPFRPVAFDPAWRTATVAALAQGVYAGRDFARLPVLADALEDAGCDAALLAHLRGSGPHVRGCWALDLVLGKA